MCLPRTNLLRIPPLKPGQINQQVVGAYHAEDVCTGKLPSILDKLLKPAPRLLRLLDRGQLRCAGLVLREFGTDQVKYWDNSFPDLDAVCLPGVPFLDQLVQVLLSVDFQHYD